MADITMPKMGFDMQEGTIVRWIKKIGDVVTKGDSTIKAIEAVKEAGGKVAFVAVWVDRQEGGRQKIEAMGYRVVAVFQRDELLSTDAKPHQPADCVAAY